MTTLRTPRIATVSRAFSMRSFAQSLGVLGLLALTACAQPAVAPAPLPVPAPDPGAEMRVLVKIPQAGVEPQAIARQVARTTALPTRYISASSSQWHTLGVRCATPAACEEALQRLRADPSMFEAVQRDERMRPATP